MAHNIQRAERFRSLSVSELSRIYAAKTLASAAAAYELSRRGVALPRRE